MIESAEAASLLSALTELQMPVAVLWTAYVGLGGDLLASDIESFLDGTGGLRPGDYDRLVQVANEEFMDRGEDHPVPYAEDLNGGQTGVSG